MVRSTQELVTSLSATEHSFIDTLHSLVRRNFASALRSSSSGENGNTVNADSSSILHASTSTAGKSDDDRVTAEEDVALQPLLVDLRKACNTLEDPFAGAEMRQLIATSKEGAGALQEIRTRLDYLAPYFSIATSTEEVNSDAQAAKNLASMLGIIRRLQTLYKASPFLASSHPFATPLPTPGQEGRFSFEVQEDDKPVSEGSKEIYSALQKQAKALQSASLSRQESYDSANIVRAVEEAEVELLWGRLGDLLGNTMQAFKLTSPNRTPSTTRRANHEYLFGATPAMSNDVAAFDNQNALPEYSSLEPPSYDRGDFDDEKDSFDSVKEYPVREVNGQAGGRTLPRTPVISSSDEKMQMDLDRMASAIERLYVSAPQLANQRVDAVNYNNIEARQQMREKQLAKLGSAIERLCKGRLEDQRASLLHHNQNENLNNPFASSRSRSKSRERDLQKESLDRLLDEIDRAAARTLDGQRASMNSRQQNALIGARKTARLATVGSHLPLRLMDTG